MIGFLEGFQPSHPGFVGNFVHLGGNGSGFGNGFYNEGDQPEIVEWHAGFCGGGDDCSQLLVTAGTSN